MQLIFYILASSELPSGGNPRVPRFPDIVSPLLHLWKANLGEGRESNVKTNLMLTREEDSPRADGTMLSLQMSMSSCGIVRLWGCKKEIPNLCCHPTGDRLHQRPPPGSTLCCPLDGQKPSQHVGCLNPLWTFPPFSFWKGGRWQRGRN